MPGPRYEKLIVYCFLHIISFAAFLQYDLFYYSILLYSWFQPSLHFYSITILKFVGRQLQSCLLKYFDPVNFVFTKQVTFIKISLLSFTLLFLCSYQRGLDIFHIFGSYYLSLVSMGCCCCFCAFLYKCVWDRFSVRTTYFAKRLALLWLMSSGFLTSLETVVLCMLVLASTLLRMKAYHQTC